MSEILGEEKPNLPVIEIEQKSIGELRKGYSDAIDFLDENYAYFLTHVLNIGKPQWTNIIPTAAVALFKESNKEREDFEFIFNPTFGSLLDTEDMAFILGHETMHVVLDHLRLARRFPDKMAFNCAADAVINDWLADMGLALPKVLPVVTGERLVGKNVANSTVADVYAMLKKQQQQCNCDSCDCEDKDDCNDGNCDCDECHGHGQGEGKCGDQEGDQSGYGAYGQGYGQIDDHGWIHGATEDQAKKTEKALEGAEGKDKLPQSLEDKKQDEAQKGYSPTGLAGGGPFKELGIKFKWAELLKKINPFVFNQGPKPKASWHRKPRKLMGFPGTNLPTYAQGDKKLGGTKPAIVMALDTSGSIGYEDSNRFVNLARIVPQQKIKLFVCTFTERYRELDLENPQWNSGGTEFGAIEKYIQEVVMPANRGRYPTSVVVVTDGMANFYQAKPQEHKPWLWLLTERGTDSYISKEGFGSDQILPLSDYAEIR